MDRLSENLTADGTVGPITARGGDVWVQGRGDFGSGTLAIQVDLDGNGFATDESFTSDDAFKVEVPQGARVQAVLSGSSSPDLDVAIVY